MEMEMRAREDIEMGQDVTPPLSPLSFALDDSLLLSHCSACFTPLPPHPHPPPLHPAILYCSPRCSNYDSALHFSSAEPHLLRLLRSRPSAYPHSGGTSDLRLALRFLQSHPSTCRPPPSGRIAGLLTNREKLAARLPPENPEADEIFAIIRDGARAMAAARRTRDGLDGEILTEDARLELEEEAALCLVLTNAVEVQDKSGRTLGVALYGRSFSWINHSCSPNACYRVSLLSEIETLPFSSEESPLRIVPYCAHDKETRLIESGFCSGNVLKTESQSRMCYGPRIIVRSIKRIKKGEEVTVAYTDVLRPKARRQSELWSRYCFICFCKRCGALPPSYVDHALEEISVVNAHSSCANNGFDKDTATEMLTEYIDDAIGDYLSVGDSQSCCEKLSHILTQGLLDEQLEFNEGTSPPTYWLHPLNHLSLNAYTTLASAYKTRANNLVALFSEPHGNLCEAFEMSRTGAAYSLLLAGATNHLFQFEPSLIASVANFWVNAGESLLDFARSSIWSEVCPVASLSSVAKYKCLKCSVTEKVIQICIRRHRKRETDPLHGQVQYSDFANVSNQLLNCVIDYTEKVWFFLIRGCHHLKVFKDPLAFSWFATTGYSDIWASHILSNGINVSSSSGTKENAFEYEAQEFGNSGRICLLQLGLHCLLYGSYLGSICFGEHSHLTCHIQNILKH
ncbi:SET domain containing protein [Parasponia andersonii]|uniref:SET domain containing protein n=1 Tax=Parasponia andersonii TaxID=3476 RepID=A0A2P5B3W5_PARAD|nr:SET domain containing protein [Parasponia andersonii]